MKSDKLPQVMSLESALDAFEDYKLKMKKVGGVGKKVILLDLCFDLDLTNLCTPSLLEARGTRLHC